MEIEKKLEGIEKTAQDNSLNFKEWNLDFLCDYIVNTHHKTVMRLIPQLLAYTKKISEVHGRHHPELLDVEKLFSELAVELLQHLKNEEEVLFPAVKNSIKFKSEESRSIIMSEISRMKDEHVFAGGTMDKINSITGNYMVPPDSCNTYMITFQLLKEFEDDLHVHVHLENNILYPGSLNLNN